MLAIEISNTFKIHLSIVNTVALWQSIYVCSIQLKFIFQPGIIDVKQLHYFQSPIAVSLQKMQKIFSCSMFSHYLSYKYILFNQNHTNLVILAGIMKIKQILSKESTSKADY